MKQRTMLVVGLSLLCGVQLAWFAPKTLYAVGFDGMAYTGIAATLRPGRSLESVDAFRSPLISWLIALTPGLSVLAAGKLITLLSFLGACILLYVFTLELWQSELIAATAVALLLLARGLTFFAVALVTPDYLFALIVLLYFIAILRSLRGALVEPRPRACRCVPHKRNCPAVAGRLYCHRRFDCVRIMERKKQTPLLSSRYPNCDCGILGYCPACEIRSFYNRLAIEDKLASMDTPWRNAATCLQISTIARHIAEHVGVHGLRSHAARSVGMDLSP